MNENVKSEEKQQLKDILYKRRRELDLTLEEIAKKCGVSKGTVCRWESGQIGKLSHDKIAKLAAALQISPGYLSGWTNDPSITFNENMAAALADLDENEEEMVLHFISFLKSQRKQIRK